MLKITEANRRAERERYEIARIDTAVRYVSKTGKCISCKTEPARHGMTCKQLGCIAKWLKIDTTNASFGNGA